METRSERIVLETSRHRISGELTLPREGYRSRLSDYLNRSELSFIPLADVEIGPLAPNGDPESMIYRDFVAVAVRDIGLAYPEAASEA